MTVFSHSLVDSESHWSGSGSVFLAVREVVFFDFTKNAVGIRCNPETALYPERAKSEQEEKETRVLHSPSHGKE